MPISCSRTLQPPEDALFRDIDYAVMGGCFEVHNQLGNLHKEKVYLLELHELLTRRGIQADMQVSFNVSFDSFQRRYACDLLVKEGVIYETKAEASLRSQHQEQVLHYVFLSDLPYDKLINFPPLFCGKPICLQYVDPRRATLHEVMH